MEWARPQMSHVTRVCVMLDVWVQACCPCLCHLPFWVSALGCPSLSGLRVPHPGVPLCSHVTRLVTCQEGPTSYPPCGDCTADPQCVWARLARFHVCLPSTEGAAVNQMSEHVS